MILKRETFLCEFIFVNWRDTTTAFFSITRIQLSAEQQAPVPTTHASALMILKKKKLYFPLKSDAMVANNATPHHHHLRRIAYYNHFCPVACKNLFILLVSCLFWYANLLSECFFFCCISRRKLKTFLARSWYTACRV